MGAVIGGAYACGVDLEKLERLLKTLDLNKLLRLPRTSFLGFVGNTAQEYLFKRRDWRQKDTKITEDVVEFFKVFTSQKDFDVLEIPFAVETVDVDTGEEVILKEGLVARAIAAGVAIPGIHYPVKIDGRFLVDGGLVSKVPVDLAFSLGADCVIGVDVSLPVSRGGVSSIEVLMQAEAIMMKELTQLKLKTLRLEYKERFLLLEPPVDDVKTLLLEKIESPSRAGYQETERKILEIKALIANHGA
jgi:NTE family protein